jgi:7,8-dihydroneopterin aldolase/epimerase/oxygenase
MDQIHVQGIRAYGYTGFLPEEQVLGQWFTVDVSINVDLNRAGTSDRIEDTIDYRAVIQIVKEVIQSQTFALVEKLASVICDRVLVEMDVKQVTLKLTKEAPPIPDFGGTIMIELTRFSIT